MIRLFEEVFSWLPLATVIDDQIFVCHGGISDTIDLDTLSRIDRHRVSVLSVKNAIVVKTLTRKK